MKIFIPITIISLAISLIAAADPIGICLHAYSPEAPPDKIECFEFEKSETMFQGKRYFLKNGQPVVITDYKNRGVILYPKNPTVDSAHTLEVYETQARQIPSTRQFLNPWILKLRNSLAETSKQAEAASKLPDLTTTDGKSYIGITITKVEPDGIRIMHQSGSAKIPFEKLSESLRAKYGYDAAKATEFRRLQEAKDQAAEKVMEASIPKIEATSDRKEIPMTKSAFEKLPDATEIAMSGPLEANMVYQFTGPVIQVTEEFLLVQNIVTRQPFGMLVFGDPKKVGNIAIESGPAIQAAIRFKQFKDLPMAGGTTKRLAVFDCLGFLGPGNKYIDTSSSTAPAPSTNIIEKRSTGEEKPAIEQIYKDSGDDVLEEARKSMLGIWTYTGTGMQVWIKWDIRNDGTMLEYRSKPINDNWGEPKVVQWKIITDKFSDTGKRYYAFRTESWTGVIQKNGNVYLTGGNSDLPMHRGDEFPFSK